MTADGCELCAAMDPLVADCALQRHLRPGQPRVIVQNDRAVAIPTIGAFTPGYVLIAPRRHVLSLGQLDQVTAEGVQDLLAVVRTRLHRTYRQPVLVFEYGLHVPSQRRVEHAHLHVLPTSADLHGWLWARLPGGRPVRGLGQLPATQAASYILVCDQTGGASVFPVPNDAAPRIRLRQVVAALDPELADDAWDWQAHPCADLMQQTVDDLGIDGNARPPVDLVVTGPLA